MRFLLKKKKVKKKEKATGKKPRARSLGARNQKPEQETKNRKPKEPKTRN